MVALEAKLAKATKAEMGGAIAKVHRIMADFGLTIEHLAGPAKSALSGKKGAVKKSAAAKATGGRPAKYADPKTGATWSGFGRAPGWIANAKNREDFLVGKAPAAQHAVEAVATAAKKPSKRVATAPVAKKASRKAGGIKKVAKTAVQSAVAASKATAKKVAAAPNKAVAKKAARKKVATKSTGRSAAAEAAVADANPAQASTEAAAS